MHNKDFRKLMIQKVKEKKILRKGVMKVGEAFALDPIADTISGVPVYITIVIQDREDG